MWMPPDEQRAGDIVLVDSTNFTTLFGGTKKSRDLLEEPRGDEVSGGVATAPLKLAGISDAQARKRDGRSSLLRVGLPWLPL